MVDNSVFSPKRLTILIDPAYSSFIRKLSMPHISSSEDLYGPSCVLVPARVLPHTLSGAALASLLAPSSAFPLKSRGHAHHSPTVLATWDIRSTNKHCEERSTLPKPLANRGRRR